MYLVAQDRQLLDDTEQRTGGSVKVSMLEVRLTDQVIHKIHKDFSGDWVLVDKWHKVVRLCFSDSAISLRHVEAVLTFARDPTFINAAHDKLVAWLRNKLPFLSPVCASCVCTTL